MGIILGFLRALKLPFKILKGWLRKKKKSKRDELHRKLRTHLWNFSPGRLKNRTWQKEDKQKKLVKSGKKRRKPKNVKN